VCSIGGRRAGREAALAVEPGLPGAGIASMQLSIDGDMPYAAPGRRWP
jgi:hypothetical protein